MKRLLKWFGVVAGALLVIGTLAVVFVLVLAARTVQPANGQMDIAGLSAPVSVMRDANGVPHIEAKTKVDAAMALGFSHAQDRLWQMEFLRMTGQGRLSEIIGVNEKVQNIDRLLRALGFAEQVTKSFPKLDAESRVVLEAYAGGVNAFLNRKTRMLEPALPPEFIILGHAPEPWKPEHSLVVLKIMSLQLSMNMDREIKRLGLAARGLSPPEIDDILPYHRDDSPPPMPDMRDWYQLVSPEETASLDPVKSNELNGWMSELGTWASNNWVLSGNRTQSGKPLLANDPHLAFNAPSLWYLAHLSWLDADGKRVNNIGATIPAMPGVVLGRNDRVAWGFTNAGADVQDLYFERINPKDPSSYFTADGWKKFDVREEIIKVKGAADIKFARRVSRHGPVLPRSFKDYGKILRDDAVLSLRWTGLSQNDRSFEQINQLAEAESVEHFGRIVAPTIAPMQAMVVADDQGSIGLFARATVPLRSADNAMQGRAPVPSWDPKYDWVGTVPTAELTAIINPENGALGTANSRFVASNKPFMTFDWNEAFRHDRVQQTVVNANRAATVADMIAAQMDTYSPAMADMRDTFLTQMNQQTRHRAVVEILSAWDGKMEAEKPAPLIITAFFRNAIDAIYRDDLGAMFETVHTAPAASMMRVLNQGGARDWCDRRKTGVVESCGDVLSDALEATVVELTAMYGPDPNAWKWGDAHVISNEHNPFGQVNVLKGLFNIERPSSGGSYALMRAKTKFSNQKPYRAVHGAGYRAVYDFSNLDKSIYVQSTGQSGNVMSGLYDDQVDLWTSGRYLTMSTKRTDYGQGALGTWVLSPKVVN